MIEYESLIYLDVNRTGSGQVIDLFERILDEPVLRRRRHGPITWRRPWAPRGKVVFATVRNPWDWYVSLWAWGLDGKSAVHRWLRHALPKEELRALYHPAEPAVFRRWLAAIHDPAFAQRFLRERYPQSGLAPFMGFYTYRFQRTTTTYPGLFLRRWRIGGPDAIRDFHRRRKAYGAVLRLERLRDDLECFVGANRERCRFRPDAQSTIIAAADRQRVHASRRPFDGYSDYYDDEARDLVARRDRFFIEEFGYEF